MGKLPAGGAQAQQHSRCPICEGSDATVLVRAGRDYLVSDGRPPEFDVMLCRACTIGYSVPSMSNGELAAYYPPTYEPYVRKRGLLGWLTQQKLKMDVRAVERLVGVEGGKVSVFEIGAGNGEFLAQLKLRGHAVSGLEPAVTARQSARDQFGIDLLPGYAEDHQYREAHDFVVARYSLEHVNHPRQLLKSVQRDGLTLGGTLFLRLPDMGGWQARLFGRYWSGWDLPRHRVHFTRRGIRRMLESVGFADIRVKAEVVPQDLLRDLRVVGRHGPSAAVRRTVEVVERLPVAARLGLAQAVCMTLAPLGASRMTVTARSIG